MKEILQFATAWMNLEDPILRVISLRTALCEFCLYEVPWVVKFIETEGRMGVSRG
jgi:hypothetical protein